MLARSFKTFLARCNRSNVMSISSRWVLIDVIAEVTGYTKEAIRSKRKKGVWRDGVHSRKAPDGRVFYDLEAIWKWVEGKLE